MTIAPKQEKDDKYASKAEGSSYDNRRGDRWDKMRQRHQDSVQRYESFVEEEKKKVDQDTAKLYQRIIDGRKKSA